MGIFNFLKDVGEKLGFGDGDDDAPKAEALKEEIAKHGLEAKDLSVEVEGDKVRVAGNAPSNSMREKIILAMGNVMGVSSVEEDISVADAEPDATFYTVEKGDNLWKIAEAHYGKGKGGQYNAIFEANRPMLNHPDKIYPGQMLRIPPLDAA